MNKKSSSSLWVSFAVSSCASVILSFFLGSWIIIFFRRMGIVDFRLPFPYEMIVISVFSGIIIGTIMMLIVGCSIINPLAKLREAIREVARGNFDVRLDEKIGIEQIREMVHDFNIMADEISGIETLRNDFIANVSHEIKTPLSSIEGYATLLQNDEITEQDRKEYSEFIFESAKKLSTLTSNILKLSKLENQEIVQVKNKFSLDEQLRLAILTLEPQWTEKEHELDIELEHIIYFGSEELLLQVWLNLLGNAVKFTPSKKKISVSLYREDGAVVVKIADEGIGIPKEAQSHIFEKFYQADKMRSSGGTGLGLALVSRIVTLCEGSVSVESEEGKGSVFTVKLPE